MLCRVQEGGVAVGADVVQGLMVLSVFVAGVAEERLNGPAGLVLPAVPAGNAASGQAAFLHFAPGPIQVPGAVQVSRFAALADPPILPTGAAAADLLSAAHWGALPSRR